MSYKNLLILAASLICLTFVCASQNAPEGPDEIRVVTTILPYEEMIKSVGGDRVSVAVMVPPGAEPHTFEPTPSQIRQIVDADIYVKNGAGLETWLENVIKVNQEMLVVDASEGIDLIRGFEHDHEGEDGAEEHEDHISRADPHTWLSLRNARILVENICDGFIEVDPANREYYARNRDAYLERIQVLDSELNSTFAKTPRKEFIVLHPAWSYFARDYGLEEIAINVEEKEPSPKHIAEVIDAARRNNITTVFVEPQYNPKSAETIASELNGAVMALDPLEENYLENMNHVGKEIAESLL